MSQFLGKAVISELFPYFFTLKYFLGFSWSRPAQCLMVITVFSFKLESEKDCVRWYWAVFVDVIFTAILTHEDALIHIITLELWMDAWGVSFWKLNLSCKSFASKIPPVHCPILPPINPRRKSPAWCCQTVFHHFYVFHYKLCFYHFCPALPTPPGNGPPKVDLIDVLVGSWCSPYFWSLVSRCFLDLLSFTCCEVSTACDI